MTVSIALGGMYGDEGKGKVISYLAVNDDPSIVARAGVGPNAGHTVYRDGKKFKIREIPTGFVNPNTRLLIGAGVLINPEITLKEIKEAQIEDRIGIDGRCTVITQDHIDRDKKSEHLSKTVKSTGTGCGPANEDRVKRVAKLVKDEPSLAKFVTDVAVEVNEAVDKGDFLMIRRPPRSTLSLYYGTYPYVTSKDTNASTFAADVGLGPTKIDNVYLAFKAYMSRVGAGPFDTYVDESNINKHPVLKRIYDEAEKMGSVNETLAEYFDEKGTVTGRLRKVGSFDYKLAKYSLMLNGTKDMVVTCLDKLFPETVGVTDYGKLSSESKAYLDDLAKKSGGKIVMISTGPNPEDMVDLR
jgi:adenylosuccinate synthase